MTSTRTRRTRPATPATVEPTADQSAPVADPATEPTAVEPTAQPTADTATESGNHQAALLISLDATTDPATTVAVYRATDVKGKAALRRRIDQAVDAASTGAVSAMVNGHGDLADTLARTAQHLIGVRDAVRSAGSVPVKAPVDYTALLADRIMAARTAADLLATEPGRFVPDGVTIDTDRLAVMVGDGELITRSAFDAALAYAGTPLTRRSTADGGRRPAGSVQRHIDEWRTSVTVGTTATVSQLARYRSTVYPDARPGELDGRIAAHLFPEAGPRDDMIGVVTVPATATSPRGVVAVAFDGDDDGDTDE